MFFYSIAIKIYVLFIYLASPFNVKAKKAVQGRRGFFTQQTHQPQVKYIWFHCSSLGEFEQGRPLIEQIKREYPAKKILLSFFSPSGYEVRKDYALADQVIYLPFDSASHAKKLLALFNVEMAVFVKYDIWPFYLNELLAKKIPVFLTSAVFRKNHFFFQWYGAFLKKRMLKMNKIFVQNEASKLLADANGFTNVVVTGDVRIDRVLAIKKTAHEMPEVKAFLGSDTCIIFGSVYKSDEVVIHYLLQNNPDVKIIIAPHKVDEAELAYFQKKFPGALLFKHLSAYRQQRILLVDHVGSLSQLYQFAHAVYIGGGFEKGIHNILEPAVFNIPVYFGPAFQKFPEAKALILEELAVSDESPLRLAKKMAASIQQQHTAAFVQKSEKWFLQNSGSTDLVFSVLRIYF